MNDERHSDRSRHRTWQIVASLFIGGALAAFGWLFWRYLYSLSGKAMDAAFVLMAPGLILDMIVRSAYDIDPSGVFVSAHRISLVEVQAVNFPIYAFLAYLIVKKLWPYREDSEKRH
jgi:hypothetical protein